ncbi:vWA domain-containing protein [Shewanella chilikensis]|jgi:Ca-activated chloride channel family protein|uniref:vWA domain-containing protein n=1 Tax=Shewanella chilikensis TaxID=558541 RepID=UPI001CD28C90|nr:VWA domain-containing protein [Shewanella chilikensis]MCA0951049.1 VWA domain-containing protein [Shewanella chilikensis]
MSLHFIRPEWLWALVPLALLLVLQSRRQAGQSDWDRYIAPHLAPLLLTQGSKNRRNRLPWLGLGWLVAVLALSGPALYKKPLPVFASSTGRVLVMDMSLSMYATDAAPNRLTQARFRATDLLEQLNEGETALLAYAGDAFVISPLTRDRNTLLNLLPTLSPVIMPVRGSNLVAALEKAKELLSQGGHLQGDIILMTDGVGSRQLNAAKQAIEGSHYRLGILAIGSSQGAPIRLPDGQLLKDSRNEVVVPATDFGLLSELASAGNGILVPYSNDGKDLQTLQQWLATSSDATETDLAGDTWVDLGPYLALLLLLPLLLSFRSGLPVLLLPLSLGLLVSPPSQASGFDDLWQTRDQQGMQAFKQEDFATAADKFVDPAWQGSARYRGGDYQGALQAFEQDGSATGLYNQGNALMQLGQYEEAIKRYSDALTIVPDMQDAIDNKALAESLLKQRKQQQDQQSQDKQEGQSQQDQQQNSQSGKDQSQGSQDSAQGDNSQSQNQDKEQGQDSQADQGSSKDSHQGSDKDANKENSEPSTTDSQQNDADNAAEKDAEKDAKGAQNPQNAEDNTGASSEPEMQAALPQEQEPQNESSTAAGQNGAGQQDGSETDADKANSASRAEQQEGPNDEQIKAQVAASSLEDTEPLPPEMERALKALVDDPATLLRNKMQLEYQKRRQRGETPKDNEQW